MILLVPMSILSIYMYVTDNYQIGIYMNSSMMINVYYCVLFPLLGAYLHQSISEYELSLFPKIQILTCKLVAGFLFCFSALVFPLSFLIYTFLAGHIALDLFSNYLFFLVGSWFMQSIFLLIVGGVIGVIKVKKGLAYALAFFASLIVSPFFQNFIIAIFHEWEHNRLAMMTLNLLNISFEENFRERYLSYGVISNNEFAYSFAFYVFFGLLMILLYYFVSITLKKRTRTISGILAFLSFLALCMFGTLYYQLAPVIHDFTPYYHYYEERPLRGKIDVLFEERDDPLIISKYDMDITMKTRFKNSCTLIIDNPSDLYSTDEIELKLDSCFDIDGISMGGFSVDYKRNSNYIMLLNTKIKAKEQIIITITYSGRIDYVDYLHARSFFCTDNAAYLPELFSWYPKLIGTDNEKEFNVKVNANNNLVSNLSDHKAIPKASNLILQGTRKDIYLFTGYIETAQLGNKAFTMPQEYVRNMKGVEKAKKIYQIFSEAEELYLGSLFSDERLIPKEKFLETTAFVFVPFSYNMVGASYLFEDVVFVSEAILNYY